MTVREGKRSTLKTPPAKRKGGLVKRLAKTTGTTTGEAKGIMKTVRQDIRAGNKGAARKTLKTALSGGPAGGVKAPGASSCADVTVPCGMPNAVRLSHAPASADAAASVTMKAAAMTIVSVRVLGMGRF